MVTVSRNALFSVQGSFLMDPNNEPNAHAKVTVDIGKDGDTVKNSVLYFTGGTGGLVRLDDTLVVNVDNAGGYRPRQGDTFTIIDCNSPVWSTTPSVIAGSFETFGSNLTSGLAHSDPNDYGSSLLPAFSGAIDGAFYIATFEARTYGDINGDGSVDGGDLSLLGGAWLKPGGTWQWDPIDTDGNGIRDAGGDFNGDGNVDGGDLALMGGAWLWSKPGGAPPEGAPIPEPLTAALLGISGLAIVRRRR